tara:strand:+ start:276 stop:620 length:345 start_codon:yes stop_codon:yes gene_type:complete
MINPSKEQILAASSGWVATTLNFLPGLGAGYIYQRRWISYFVTVGSAIIWFLLGLILRDDTVITNTEQLFGVGGLFFISIITMIESKLTHKRILISMKEKEIQNSQKKKRGLFK